MPRRHRYAPPDSVHHTINRGNDRRRLFRSKADFEAFLDLMAWAKHRSPIRILAYCLMENHWHMVLWPDRPHAISSFLQRLCTAHSLHLRRMTATSGYGHIYQDRYHAFLVESEAYYFHALRYVEANPLRAGLVPSSQEWPWSSLVERMTGDRGLLDEGPLALPATWPDLVDQRVPDGVLDEFRSRLRRH